MRIQSAPQWMCVLILAWAGCGEAPAPPTTKTAGEPPRAKTLANVHPAARTVFEFLESVRDGDQLAASTKLSPLSLQRIKELDLNISPPGSETAKFRVGGVQTAGNDRATVECIWTDTDVRGKVTDESYRWMLRNVAGEWKITGVSVTEQDGDGTVVLDFENPVGLVADTGGGQPTTSTSGDQVRQARQASPPAQPAGAR